MDNLEIASQGDLTEFVDELPREEALVRLYELLSRFGEGVGTQCPTSLVNAAQGLSEPHPFAFGCCRDNPPKLAAR